ncbi:unnamed protein product [[Candida] boidinii]|nr:unnamed protein product [[Candida] boidinii]
MNFGFDIKTPTDVLTSSSDKAISTIEEEIIEEREGFSKLEQAQQQQQQQQLNKNEIIMVTNTNLINNNVNDIIDNESGEESETSQDDLFFNFFNTSNTKTIKADFRLLFFWLPFMLLLMMIFINKQFNIKFLNFEIINSFYYKFIENIRWIMANFMLGKERVENLLNDAHEAVLTAVSGR